MQHEEHLLNLLSSNDTQIRLNALKALVQQHSSKLEMVLPEALKDDASVIRSFAVMTLADLFDNQHVSSIALLLGDRDGLVRQNVIRALRSLDRSVVDVVLPKTEDTNPLVRAGSARILGAFGSSGVLEILIRALQDHDIHTRANAAQSLGEIGDKSALQPLLEAINDPSDIVRREVFIALGELKVNNVLDMLLNKLSTEVGLARDGVVHALELLGDPKAVTPLLSMLLNTNEPEHMRDLAAMALTFLGDEGKGALKITINNGDEFAQQLARGYLRL